MDGIVYTKYLIKQSLCSSVGHKAGHGQTLILIIALDCHKELGIFQKLKKYIYSWISNIKCIFYNRCYREIRSTVLV